MALARAFRLRKIPRGLASKRHKGALFNLVAFRNLNGEKRFTVVVSGKVEKSAVARNKARRRTQEVIRQLLPAMPVGDYVIYLKKEAIDQNLSSIKNDLEKVFHTNIA